MLPVETALYMHSTLLMHKTLINALFRTKGQGINSETSFTTTLRFVNCLDKDILI